MHCLDKNIKPLYMNVVFMLSQIKLQNKKKIPLYIKIIFKVKFNIK